MKRLALVFPGIGYTVDKPLLHYGRRLAESFGYACRLLPYGGFPKKTQGDGEWLRRTCELALAQTRGLLADTDLKEWDELLFIGKSIGTVIAAQIAEECGVRDRARFVLYTPLEETFARPLGDAIVFTGSGDPFVGGKEGRIPALCGERAIPCFVVEDANHSLETDDPERDIRNLEEVMRQTAAFLRESQLRRIARCEALLQALQAAVSGPAPSAEALPALREAADALAKYYAGEDWKRDFADDEAGLLPPELKRGVLSEDGIYNALEAWRELLRDMDEGV